VAVVGPALSPHQQLDHGQTVPHVGFHPCLAELGSCCLDRCRVELHHIETSSVQAGGQNPVVMTGRLDPEANTAGADPTFDVTDRVHQPGDARRCHLEHDRVVQDPTVVIGDQRHRAVLAHINRNNQTLRRSDPLNPSHVVSLCAATSETHLNLHVVGTRHPSRIPHPWTHYENLAPSPPEPAHKPRMSRSPAKLTPMAA
jgi:hypothetical protein